MADVKLTEIPSSTFAAGQSNSVVTVQDGNLKKIPIDSLVAQVNANADNITSLSGNVQSLSSGVTGLTNSLATTNQNVSANTNGLTTAQGNISTLQASMSTAQGDIDTLEADKVNVSDVLTLEEMEAASSLDGKLPNAASVMSIKESLTTLTDRISVSAASNGGTWSGTLPDTRHRILVMGHTGYSNLCGIYLLYQSNVVMPIVPAPSLSVTIPGGRLLTITNNSSGTTGGTMNGVII